MTEVPEWAKYLLGAGGALASYVPLSRFRFSRIEKDLQRVESSVVDGAKLVGAVTELTLAVAELANTNAKGSRQMIESNVRVVEMLTEVKRFHERVDRVESENRKDHEELRAEARRANDSIKDDLQHNYISRATFEVLKKG